MHDLRLCTQLSKPLTCVSAHSASTHLKGLYIQLVDSKLVFYASVFEQWQNDGIIYEATGNEYLLLLYLPFVRFE